MKKLTYMITGWATIAISIILMITNSHAFRNIPVNLSGNDPWELYFPVGTIVMVLLGIVYLLFAFGKYETNKNSDRALKLGIWAFIVGVVGFFGVLLLVFVSGGDGMGMIWSIPFLFAAVVMFIIAFIFGLMAFGKKEDKRPVEQPVAEAPAEPAAKAPEEEPQKEEPKEEPKE